MNKRLNFSLGTLLCAATLVSQSSSAETLKEIYEQALQNDHQFKAAQADYAAGLENKNIARAALLPQITASAGWSETDSHNNLPVPVGADADSTLRQQSYGVGLQQSLVNIPAWYNYNRGKTLSNQAEAQFVNAEQTIILRTTNAYFDALKAVDSLATAKAEEEALAHQLEQTKQRFEVGLTAITEVHEAQAAFDSATANRLVAEGNLGIAFEALEVITGESYQSLKPLKTEFPVQPPAPLERAPWEKLALENNAQLKIASFQSEAAALAAKAAKGAHLPTLNGSISYGNQRTDLYENPTSDSDADALTVGLSLTVPLFAGGGTSASRRQAANVALSAKEALFKVQRDVVQATRSAHLGVLTSAATVKARQQAITSSRSALEATQAGYDVGTRDLVDVLNAQRNLYTAQRNYYDALYSYVIATLQLKQAAGVLASADINELDTWLDQARSVDYPNRSN